MSKQYGLILPGKKDKPAPSFKSTRNVFGDDSDSADERISKKPMLKASEKLKKQVQLAQQKALTEDPTVYQYDELYDNMEVKKKEEKTALKAEKAPKYIEKLLESANKRKRENERRLERQVQKERENEGSEFADKESFVTSAYKQKLEELRAEEEQEKREEYLENIGDVTKQRDLGGFYRHLYEQKLGSSNTTDKSEKGAVHKTKEESSTPNKTEKYQVPQIENKNKDAKKKRNYRKRTNSDRSKKDLSDGEISSDEEKIHTLEHIKATKKRALTESNIDEDSDFSIDSDESDDSNKGSKKKKLFDGVVHKGDKEIDDKNSQKIYEKQKLEKKQVNTNKETEETKQSEKISNTSVQEKDNDKNVSVTAEPKINIWEKRTVGVVFEEALKRYYERKAARCH